VVLVLVIPFVVLLAATTPPSRPAEGRPEGPVARSPGTPPIVPGEVSSSCRTSVVSPQQTGRARSFSAARVLGLLFRTAIDDATQAPRLRLRLYSPGGELYQVVRYREPRAVPSSLRRRSPPPPPRAYEAAIPIAGSQVIWGSLYGRWTAVTRFEGQPGSCGGPVSFVITP
jgi:hypothetical protein